MAIPIIADINAKLNQQSMSSVLSSVKSQFQSQGIDIKMNIPDLSKNANGFRLVADSVNKTTDSIGKFGEQAGIATKRLLAYTAAVTAIIGPLNLLRNAVDEAIKFQREIIRVAQVAGDTKSELKSLQDQITSLAKTYGVSSLELIKAATIFRQAGFNARETASSVEILAKALLSPNFSNFEGVAETIVALKSQFKDATKDAKSLEDVIGGLNAVAGAFPVEAKDLEEAIKRAGGAFAAAGGSVQELSALLVSVRGTTRESAETIATSFRTIFARLQRADIIDQLKQFGIELRRTKEEAIGLGDAKLEGQFVGAYEAIRRLSTAVKDLPTTDSRFAAIAEEIGGYRQLSKTIPLLQQFATAQEALNVAQSGAASLNINAAQAQDSYAVKLQKVKEQLLDLGRNIVNSQGFATFFNLFEKGASAAIKLTEALAPLIPLLTILATIKITTGLTTLFSGFGKGLGSQLDTQGRAIHRNSGGTVPGVGTGDTVPAMLTPGEYVLRKEAVQRVGVGTLNAMNSGKPRGYAAGGFVTGYTLGSEGGGTPIPINGSGADKLSTSINKLSSSIDGLAGKATRQGSLFPSEKDEVNKKYGIQTPASGGYASHGDGIAGPTSSSRQTEGILAARELEAKRAREDAIIESSFKRAPTSDNNVRSLRETGDIQRQRAAERETANKAFEDRKAAESAVINKSFKSGEPTGPVVELKETHDINRQRNAERERANKAFEDRNANESKIINDSLPGYKFPPPPRPPFKKLPLNVVDANETAENQNTRNVGLSRATLDAFQGDFNSPRKTGGFLGKLFRSTSSADSTFGDLLNRAGDSGVSARDAVDAVPSRLSALGGRIGSFAKGRIADAKLDLLRDNSRIVDSKTGFSTERSAGDVSTTRAIGRVLTDNIAGAAAGGLNLIGGIPGGLSKLGGLAASGGQGVANIATHLLSGVDGGSLLEKSGNLLKGGVGRVGNGLSNLGKGLTSPLGLGGVFLAAEAIRGTGNNDISAQTAAQGPLSGVFARQEGVKGALGTAQLGVGIGASLSGLLGPLGIAVGAVTGAMIGYADGQQEAEKKISQVKLDESLGKLKTEIDDIAAGKGGLSSTGNINNLLANARNNSFENTQKSLQPGLFDRILADVTGGHLGSSGPKTQDLVFAQRENLKNQLGLQLPQLNQIAGRQATEGAKSIIGNRGALDTDSIKAESQKFATQFTLVNTELLRSISLVKGISVEKVVKEFQKQFEDQAKALSQAKRGSDAKGQSENILNSIDRLAKAFNAASEAASETAKANIILSDTFGATASVIQTKNLATGIGNIGVAGGTAQDSFNSSFGIISKLVGSESFTRTGLGLNTAKQSLPDVLVNSLKHDHTGGDEFFKRINAGLQDVPDDIRKSIVSKIEAMDFTELTKKMKESGEKLAEELSADYAPFKDAVSKMAADVTAQSNALITGLSQAGRNQNQIESTQNQSDILGFEGKKLSAGFKASNIRLNDKFSTVGASDFITENEALDPFRQQQRRVLKDNKFLDIRNIENPEAIAATIPRLREDAKNALARREANPTDAGAIKNSDAAQQALSGSVQGLRNIKDSTERLKLAQDRLADTTDKLNKFSNSRQNEGDLNKRIIRAQSTFDFQDLRNIDQGIRGSNFLAKGGNFNQLQGFNPELAKNTLDFAEQNRNLIIPGESKVFDRDENGNIKKDKFGNQLKTGKKNVTLGQILDEATVPQAGKDENSLKAKLKAEQDAATKEKERQKVAAKAYAEVLDKSNQEFIKSLDDTFKKFGQYVAEQKNAVETGILKRKRDAVEVEQASLGQAQAARKTLSTFGITKQSELDVVKANAPDLEKLATLQKQQSELTDDKANEASNKAINDFNKYTKTIKYGREENWIVSEGVPQKELGKVSHIDDNSKGLLQSNFATAGFTDPRQIAQLVEQFEKKFVESNGKKNAGAIFQEVIKSQYTNDRNANQLQIDASGKAVRSNFDKAGLGEIGFNLVNNPASIQTILESSAKLGGTIDGLDANIKRLSALFDDLTKKIEQSKPAPKKQLPPGFAPGEEFDVPVRKAMGGPIFSPRGTDTVPAMLTPGEFVVRAAATRNNLPLLNKINSSSGPVYAATGGVIQGGSTGVSFDSTGMKAAFDSFVSGTQALVSAMNAFPREITGSFTHKVEVIHNGIEVLNNLDDKVSSAVMAKVEKRFEDFGNSLRSQGFRV